MVHIINKLQLSDRGLVVKGTKQEVHLQQGTMDGACSVYSMMMCLIIIGSIRRRDVESLNDDKIKGNTSKGRLIRTFLYNNGFVRKGKDLSDLKKELLRSYRKSVTVDYFGADDIVKNIKESLDENYPVELGFVRKSKGGHAVVAIGYEQNDTDFLFYILDPGYPIPYGQYWNNVIKVETSSNRKYNGFNFVEKSAIQIDEALVIKKQ